MLLPMPSFAEVLSFDAVFSGGAISQERRDRPSSCAGKKCRKYCPYGPDIGQNYV
jgi:hypothetical protein